MCVTVSQLCVSAGESDSQLLCAFKSIRFCLHQFHAGAVDVNMLLLLPMDVDICVSRFSGIFGLSAGRALLLPLE